MKEQHVVQASEPSSRCPVDTLLATVFHAQRCCCGSNTTERTFILSHITLNTIGCIIGRHFCKQRRDYFCWFFSLWTPPHIMPNTWEGLPGPQGVVFQGAQWTAVEGEGVDKCHTAWGNPVFWFSVKLMDTFIPWTLTTDPCKAISTTAIFLSCEGSFCI